METRKSFVLLLAAALVAAAVAALAGNSGDSGGSIELRLRLAPRSFGEELQPFQRADPITPPPPFQDVTVLEQRRLSAPPPKQRSPELASGQLVVVAYDSQGREVSRRIVADPRLLRAEIADSSGKFVARHNFYRPDVMFIVVLADNPTIGEVKVFQTRWTGTQFVLELIGTTPVP